MLVNLIIYSHLIFNLELLQNRSYDILQTYVMPVNVIIFEM